MTYPYPAREVTASDTRRAEATRERVLSRIVAAYERGLLVPFIGAGMSSPACPLWEPFVEKLERRAGLGRPVGSTDLVFRAAGAVRALRLGASQERLARAVAHALSTGCQEVPPQTRALAQIHWPLVVMTNYDDLYVAAAHEAYVDLHDDAWGRTQRREESHEVPLLLLGRTRDDCQRVLTSLRQPDVPLLWALQGFVGGQAQAFTKQRCGPGTQYSACLEDPIYDRRCEALGRELVVGHAEYRRVALSSEPFRRAFAELYRSRSLLFLGTGLRDKYFLDLFSEIIELSGPSPKPHFAVLAKGESDAKFLRQYFGISTLEIDGYDRLPDLLLELARRLDAPRARQSSWQFEWPRREPAEQRELRIVRGGIPARPGDGERIVFSAGGSPGRPSLSAVGRRILEDRGLPSTMQDFEPIEIPGALLPLWQHKLDPRFLAVNARLNPWGQDGVLLRPTDPTMKPIGRKTPKTAGGRARRDVRLLSSAVRELMQAAHAAGDRHVHSMLLAGGPSRTFPQTQALLQMTRGWAQWCSETPDSRPGEIRRSRPGLSIYLTSRDVLYELDAGRLDLARNLMPDVVEFWLEIATEDGAVERYLHVADSGAPLRAIVREFGIEDGHWQLELTPPPSAGWDNWTLEGVDAWERYVTKELGTPTKLSLETFGVVPGSTLRLQEMGTPSDA